MAAFSPGNALPAVSLADGRGGSAALPAGETLYGFFKTTCPTCELSWPFFERIARLAEGGTLAVVAVSQDDPAATARFNDRLGVTLPTLFDPEPWRASEALGLESVPTFLRVTADGKLRDAVVGFQKQKMQDFGTEAARLAGRPTAAIFQLGEAVPAIQPG